LLELVALPLLGLEVFLQLLELELLDPQLQIAAGNAVRAPGVGPAWPAPAAAPGCAPVAARGRLLIVLSGPRMS